MGPRPPLARWTPILVGLAALSACQKPVPLDPLETFRWAEQPISFAPPPAGWRREGYNQSGLRGVMFSKTGSVGEGITVAEYYILSDRDRRAELQQLLDRFDSLSDRELRRALALAPFRTDSPFSPQEIQVSTAVNDAILRATLAEIRGDRTASKAEVQIALEEAKKLRFSLADGLDHVLFRPERRSQPDSFLVTARRDTTLSGNEAVVTDYLFHGPERLYHGREYYLMHENHLFTAQYIGLRENLRLFDRVVSTITFPPRSLRPVP